MHKVEFDIIVNWDIPGVLESCTPWSGWKIDRIQTQTAQVTLCIDPSFGRCSIWVSSCGKAVEVWTHEYELTVERGDRQLLGTSAFHMTSRHRQGGLLKFIRSIVRTRKVK